MVWRLRQMAACVSRQPRALFTSSGLPDAPISQDSLFHESKINHENDCNQSDPDRIQVQISQVDPTLEDGWRHTMVAPNTRQVMLSGLQPGQKIWVRVRGVRLGSEAGWTEPASIIMV